MVAIKTHQAAEYLRSPPDNVRAVLLYGADSGLVSERARALAANLAARENPPGDILRFDDDSLAEDPQRMAVELQTRPMFGGSKIVRATAGRRVDAEAVRPLLEGGGLEGFLIVEAQNLAPTAPLRKLFEGAANAAAIACYADEARDLSRLVTEVADAAGLAIDAEAKSVLIERLGADRALSRSEIDKLALYAHGRRTITLEDVEAVVGDTSEANLDRIVMAVAGRRLAEALSSCDRAIAAGESPQAIILAIQRHFLRLHRVRAALDSGQSQDAALKLLRPPVFYKQQAEFTAHCRAWTLAALTAAIEFTAASALKARLDSALEAAIAEAMVLRLCRGGSQGGKR
ncbi:MAG: DNA polymerase III subunit delta [Hyphomicrobiaceae bacterium]|nr:MAG: DNA polymerase III subunit delta [Hyphomicrobiaceae bacterium]